MPVIDLYLFYNDLMPDTIGWFCRADKEASNFKKVVSAWWTRFTATCSSFAAIRSSAIMQWPDSSSPSTSIRPW